MTTATTEAPRWSTRVSALLSTLLLTMLLSTLVAAPSHAETTDSKVLAAKAVPGVQMIETTYSGTVIAEVPTVNDTAIRGLTARLVRQAQTGVIGTSQAALLEALVDMIVQDPNSFIISSGESVKHPSSVTGVGTGWAITPDGYLMTAAHVVKGSREELAATMAKKELTDASDAFVKGLAQSGSPFTADQADRLNKVVLEWYARHLKVSDLSVEVSVLLGERSGNGKTTRQVPAKVVDAGEVYPGNDVALLKIDNVANLPTERLGKDSDVEIGSTLHIVGFPAASTLSPSFSADTLAQPTVTEGPLTARKTTKANMPVFQTQAPSSPGNSGGPVLDSEGAVIGVLVAGAVEDGKALEGQGYVIPVSEVDKLLTKNNVTPQTSTTTTTYDEAIDNYYLKHYKVARPQFDEVVKLYPQHPFVADYQAKADQAIASGQDESPLGVGVWLVIASATLLFILLVVVLVVVLSRRKRVGGGMASQQQQQWQAPQQLRPQQPQPWSAPQQPQPQQPQWPAPQPGTQHQQAFTQPPPAQHWDSYPPPPPPPTHPPYHG